MERGKHKLETVEFKGELTYKGRCYRLLRERVAGTDIEYDSLLLYNETGRFIKRFCIDPEASPDIGLALADIDLNGALDEAERKANSALARYKFLMFGYWAAIWVHLNHLSGKRRHNPWKSLVRRKPI